MFNIEYPMLLKKVVPKKIKIREKDGSESRVIVYRIILQTDDISYEDYENFHPGIHQILTVDPERMLFKTIDIGTVTTADVSLNISEWDENGVLQEPVEIGDVKFVNMKIVNRYKIPAAEFIFIVPQQHGKFLINNMERTVKATIKKPDDLFTSMDKFEKAALNDGNIKSVTISAGENSVTLISKKSLCKTCKDRFKKNKSLTWENNSEDLCADCYDKLNPKKKDK